MVSCVVVLGTGAYARALSHRLESCGITCVIGSRRAASLTSTSPASVNATADTDTATAISTSTLNSTDGTESSTSTADTSISTGTSTSTPASVSVSSISIDTCERIGSSLVLPYSTAISYGASLLHSSTTPLIIILAIPASAHSDIIPIIRQTARDVASRKLILVDISNPTTTTTSSSSSSQHDKSQITSTKKSLSTTIATSQPLTQVSSDLHTPLLVSNDNEETTHNGEKQTTSTTTAQIISRCQTSCASRTRCSDQDHFTCMVEDIEDIKTIGCSNKVSPPPSPINTSNLSYSEHLQHQLPMCYVVKAFNTISAYTISQPIGTHGTNDRVLICGDSYEMKKYVSEMISMMGMIPIHTGRLIMSRDLEKRSMELFQQWHGGTFIAIMWLGVAILYVIIRDFIVQTKASGQRDNNWYDLFLLKWNIIIAWHSILCFTTVYGIGLIAAILQLYRGTTRIPFPYWLDVTLRARKSLGIYGLASAIIHCIVALCTNPLFIDFTYIQSKNGNLYQISIFCAVLSFLLFGTLGITSLSGVGQTLSWREWTFIQSKIGYVAFTIATAHILLMAMSVDDIFHHNFTTWQDYWLPVSALAAGGACIVLLIKMILTFTPLASRLNRIRTGATKV